MSFRRGRKGSRFERKPVPAGPIEARAGVHEWVWSNECGLVCAWCGEPEAMALSKGCPAVAIRDRDQQVFITRLLEPEPEHSIVDGVGVVDLEGEAVE